MVLHQEVIHPRSLTFQQMRRVIVLRDEGNSWESIAEQVVNRLGQRPTWGYCRKIYKEFHRQSNRRKYHYDRCGRKPWKVTPEVRAFLLRRLLEKDRTLEIVLQPNPSQISHQSDSEWGEISLDLHHHCFSHFLGGGGKSPH